MADNSNKAIQPLGHWKSYFDFSKLDVKTSVFMANGSVYDTINLIEKVVKEYLSDTKELAKALKGGTLRETLKNNWSWVYKHITYEKDRDGVEQVRRPLRLVADAKGDCDCFTTFLSSLLTNQGVSHTLRMTKYNGKSYYQHIYIIVDKPNGGHYTLDCVLDEFDKEHPFTAKYDNKMQIEVLHGINNGLPSSLANESYNEFVSGLGSVEPQTGQQVEEEFLKSTFEAVLHRRKQLMEVDKIAKGQDPDAKMQIKHIDLLLKSWGNESERERILSLLAKFEDNKPLTEEEQFEEDETVNGLGEINDDNYQDDDDALDEDYEDLINGIDDDEEDDLVHNLGTLDGRRSRRKKRRAKRKARRKARRKKRGGGFFGRIKKAVKKVNTAVKKVGKKAAKFAKKAVRFVHKFSPAHALIRNALLLAMKINFAGIVSKMGYGAYTEAEAKRNGWNMEEWKKAKGVVDKAKKLHLNIGGKEKNFIKNIKQGFVRRQKRMRRKGKSYERGVLGLGTLGDGGTVSGTSTAAASGLLATIGTWVKKIGKVVGKGVKAGAKVVKKENAKEDGGFFKKTFSSISKSLFKKPTATTAAEAGPGAVATRMPDGQIVYTGGANQQGMSSTTKMALMGVGGLVLVGGGIALMRPRRPLNGTPKKKNNTRKSTTRKPVARSKSKSKTTKISL